ncbi:hypothetical protein [Undibacterium sp. TS12]|uniref:hypothetical protein n=1 Tax=Undibacterium sp. TS12 TaxID=2908202 RepID=UPI001F4D1AB7|nr:hypothetical protein [Undibacterium sp. TS12]MCH8620379.1 hypothetical protein [Undibacterium sp. TS12]
MSSDKNNLAEKFEQLIKKIEELIVIVDKNDGQFWSDRFRAAVKVLKSGDSDGARDFLSNFGGNSSFNEFSLDCGTWVNDQFIADTKLTAKANDFKNLVASTRLLAMEIASETEHSLRQDLWSGIGKLCHSKPVMLTAGLALAYALLFSIAILSRT